MTKGQTTYREYERCDTEIWIAVHRPGLVLVSRTLYCQVQYRWGSVGHFWESDSYTAVNAWQWAPSLFVVKEEEKRKSRKHPLAAACILVQRTCC